MSSSARLKYKIVKCTSEDAEFPVSELLAHSSQTKGWQTSRSCQFPQEIGLQFDTPVHLRQVQFLSHQSKIATKIELFTAMPAEGQNCLYSAAQFKRLGYLSLDSNERSQFQARELKSVYVDVNAQFLRILFHKCHVNRYNIVNQVGLIALNCLGEVLGPDLAVGPPPPNPNLARVPDNKSVVTSTARSTPDSVRMEKAHVRASEPSKSEKQHRSPSVTADAVIAEKEHEPKQPASEDAQFDARINEHILALNAAKQRAVEVEDYEEAKHLKEMLALVRQNALRLRELEEQKKAAVLNEDYDQAKFLKVEIERLRSSTERPGTQVVHTPPDGYGLPASNRGNRMNNGGHVTEASMPPMNDGSRLPDRNPSPLQQTTAPRGAHQPQMPQAPMSMDGGDHMPFEDRSPTPPPFTAFPGRNHKPNFDAENHPLRGVPNLESLGGDPDALDAVKEDAAPIVAIFGDYLTRCIYSKSWNYRDAALQKLTIDFRDGVYAQKDQGLLFEGLCTILRRTIPDKNVQVFLSSAILQQAVCQLLGSGQLSRSCAQAAIEPLLQLLVERLGDANARVEKTTRDVLLDYGRCSCIGASCTAQYLMRPPKKKTARVFSSRLQVLASLTNQVGVQPQNREGIPLQETMQLAMDWFTNPAAEVRESAVKLVAACYAHVGLERIEGYLINLREAQRQVFTTEFEKVVGDQSSAQAEACVEEPSDLEVNDFTCAYCGRQDNMFTKTNLDVHYWRDCPMLTQCEFCQQVVEISDLYAHLCDECGNVQGVPAGFLPGTCPFCHIRVGSGNDRDWIEHLCILGCRMNPRQIQPRGQLRNFR